MSKKANSTVKRGEKAMRPDDDIKDETKATSQHQITIPIKIWEKLKLTPGIRFQVILRENGDMLIRPRMNDLELSDDEWGKLIKLAHSKENVTKSFQSRKKAFSYLDSL